MIINSKIKNYLQNDFLDVGRQYYNKIDITEVRRIFSLNWWNLGANRVTVFNSLKFPIKPKNERAMSLGNRWQLFQVER